MKKERPIIFSTPMVEAILEGRKTMTRRVIVPQPEYITGKGKRKMYCWKGGCFALDFFPNNSTVLDHCPYGKPGDILWVRETSQEKPAMGEHCGHCRMCKKFKGKYIYRASFYHLGQEHSPCNYWKPSIHMKREAARIFLEVVSVRVERLNSITEADAKAEGVEKFNQCKTLYEDRIRNRIIACGGGAHPIVDCVDCDKYKNTSFKNGFMFLWETLNAKRGYSWNSNPWVWVVEFRRVKK